MKKTITICVLVALVSAKGWGQYTDNAGLPIAYWDFESNTARTSALQTTPELQVNSGNTFDGKFGGLITTSNQGNFQASGNGLSADYGGNSAGLALAGESWQTITSDPGGNATTYFQFTINTTGFSGVGFTFDALTGTTSATYPYIGISYSIDGGTNFTEIDYGNLGLNTWFDDINEVLPASANNISNLKIRIYGWYGKNTAASQMRIDNFTVFATGTTLNAGSKTSVDELAFYTGTTSGLTAYEWIRYGTFTVASGSTLVLGNGGIALGSTSVSGIFTVANGGTLDCGGTTDQTIAAGQSSAASTFTLNTGGSIIIRNSAGINSSGATGDIQTTTRTFNSDATYIYGGNVAQNTGVFTTSTSQTVSKLTITNTAGVTNSQPLSVSGTLTLTSGILTTTSTNTITVTSKATASVSGGSATSFVNGPLIRTLPAALSASSEIYTFPVGSGIAYLPFSATSLSTNQSIAPILFVQAFNTSSGGIGDNTTLATNGSLSTTEYWQTGLVNNLNSGISQGTVSLSRPTVVSPYNVIATSKTQTGKYTSKGGTPSGNSINNTNNLADFAGQNYVLAQTPTIAIASVLSPTSVITCSGTASSNMTLSLSGAVLINGITVTPPSGFEVSTSSTGSFNSSVVIGSGGTLASTPVYIRLAASDAVNTYAGNITLTSTGATPPAPAAIATSTVKTTPTATITPASGAACTGTGVSVGITGTAGASLDYKLNAGTTQTVTLPISAFSSPTNTGTYTYQLTSVSLNSCVGTFTNASSTITIQALPTVAAITGGAYVQTGTTLQLTDATSGGVWSSDNGTSGSVGNTGLVNGNAEGTPTVSYTVTDNTALHCTDKKTQTVRVYNPDYITQSSGAFSSAATWQIDRDDNTFVTSVPVPAGANYTSIRVQHAITLDQDFPLGAGKSFTLILGGTMDISPNKIFSSSGSVDFGGNAVTVKSDASGTGAIGQMTSNILNATNVQVERFIGSTAFATGRRAWRLLTAPLSDATINAAWQEGLVSNTNQPVIGNPTYGTLITGYGQGTASNAFSHGYDFWDAIANNTSSIRYYVPSAASGLWNSLTTISGVKISDYPAFMLFVRGNRSVQSGTFGITTLRAKGVLKQGSFSTSVSGANTYTLVGNPFASPVDFDKIYTASTNIKPQFLVWNSQNGNFGAYTLVQRNAANSYTIIPNKFNGGTGTTSTDAQYIVSGEGFLVQPLSSAGGTVVINDNAKTSTASVGINPYRLSPDTDKKLYVNLNLKDGDSTTLADGFLARFDATYDTAVNEDDALKQANFNENLGIVTNGNNLIVEARPDITKTDTIQMKLWNVALRTYQFQTKAENFAASPDLHAFIEDSYLHTKVEISLAGTVSSVDFTVNSDTASYSQTRFRIVFQNSAAVLPVTLTSIKAATQNGGVNVMWMVTNEVNIKDYTIERSVNGGATFGAIVNVAAKNATGAAITHYAGFDATPQRGDNLYRIKIKDNNGQVSYSGIVKVTIGEDNHGVQIALYPNPVGKDGRVSLELTNLAAGTYLASIYSGAGQTVFQQQIIVAQSGATQSETLFTGGSLAQGSYPIRLTNSKGIVVFNDKMMIGR